MPGNSKTSGISQKIIVFVCLVILIFLGMGLVKNFLQKQKINREVSALQNEIANLERGNEELASLIG